MNIWGHTDASSANRGADLASPQDSNDHMDFTKTLRGELVSDQHSYLKMLSEHTHELLGAGKQCWYAHLLQQQHSNTGMWPEILKHANTALGNGMTAHVNSSAQSHTHLNTYARAHTHTHKSECEVRNEPRQGGEAAATVLLSHWW